MNMYACSFLDYIQRNNLIFQGRRIEATSSYGDRSRKMEKIEKYLQNEARLS